MSIRSLNHAVLFVSDVSRSKAFYIDTLGFEILAEMSGAVFLRGTNSANDHDLGLFPAAGPPAADGSVGLYHLAWRSAPSVRW